MSVAREGRPRRARSEEKTTRPADKDPRTPKSVVACSVASVKTRGQAVTTTAHSPAHRPYSTHIAVVVPLSIGEQGERSEVDLSVAFSKEDPARLSGEPTTLYNSHAPRQKTSAGTGTIGEPIHSPSHGPIPTYPQKHDGQSRAAHFLCAGLRHMPA